MVLQAVAEHGYGLDKLVNSEFWPVREAVAKQGYGLDELINDEDYDVLETVYDWLEYHGLTIEEYTKNKDYWYRKAIKN